MEENLYKQNNVFYKKAWTQLFYILLLHAHVSNINVHKHNHQKHR